MSKKSQLILPDLITSLSKLPEEDLNRFFYYNLFDIESWYYSSPDFDTQKYLRDVKNFMLKNLGTFSKNFKRANPTQRDNFIKSQILKGEILNEIIKNYLNKEGISCSLKFKGIDLDIYLFDDSGRHSGCIDFKRFSSSENILSELQKFSKKISHCKDRHSECKHVFACFFPVFDSENISRIKKLIIGYQYISKYVIDKDIQEKTSIFIIPVNFNGKTHTNEFALENFKRLLEQVI